MKVLITGGAGFIGQHLARRLLKQGVSVKIFDNFLPQVHGESGRLAPDLVGHVDLITGDIADSDAVAPALQGVERIVHLAAETGTGQSMYEVNRYSLTNLHGTAVLFDLIAKMRGKRIERLIVASSRAIYGEGAYRCDQDGLVYPRGRTSAEKRAGNFDPLCPVCAQNCIPIATPESAPPQPSSFYGLTKLTQEQIALLFGNAFNVVTVSLRYQNVYGPGQSLQNPYTGILAIFSNLARLGQDIRVFEDGVESRDFVYIDDVVTATSKALLDPIQGCHTVNVGSGKRVSVLELAKLINAHFGGRSTIYVGPMFREGDIRHNFADLKRVRKLLGYEPSWSFRVGLEQFLKWTERSAPSAGGYEQSIKEMRERGLLRG